MFVCLCVCVYISECLFCLFNIRSPDGKCLFACSQDGTVACLQFEEELSDVVPESIVVSMIEREMKGLSNTNYLERKIGKIWLWKRSNTTLGDTNTTGTRASYKYRTSTTTTCC